jgi:hypothetical protein
MKHQIRWHETTDNNDNTVWEGQSPYVPDEDGAAFEWRLRQRVVADKIEWYESHDAELMGDHAPESWPTIEEAKAAIQKAHEGIIADNSA